MPHAYNPHDKLMVKAKTQGYRARSVYKLMELDQKFKLFKPGQKVLDIGAAPGSWLQYVSQVVGPSGFVLGLDLQEIKPVSRNVATEIVDIENYGELEKIFVKHEISQFDLVISDIAPSTTGIKGLDNKRSYELSKIAFEISLKYLKRSGSLVMKIFQGEEIGPFMSQLKQEFGFVTAYKVRASRDRSREVYLVCIRKKISP